MYRATCKDGRIFDAKEIRTHKGNLVLMMVEYPYHEADENGVSTYYWDDMFTADRMIIKSDEVTSIWPMKGNVMDYDFSDMSDSALLAQIEAASSTSKVVRPESPIGKEIARGVEAAIAEWDSRHPD